MATPKFFLYGNSPSELAQQQAGYESRFTNAAEGNRSAAAQAAQVSLSAFLQAQAADDQARQFDARNRMALFSDERQRGDQMRRENENMRRYNVDFGLDQQDRRRAMEDRSRAMDFNTRFGIPRQEAEIARIKAETVRAQREPTSNADTAAMVNTRLNIIGDAIDAGLVDTADQIMRLAPGTPPDQAEMYAQIGKQVKAQIAMEKAAEQAKLPQPVLSPERTQGGIPSFFSRFSGARPESSMPTVSSNAPSFFSQPRTATATNSASSYIPGRRYGNLRYMGGDPNLQTSWTPAGN